jgi:hypothetical protein
MADSNATVEEIVQGSQQELGLTDQQVHDIILKFRGHNTYRIIRYTYQETKNMLTTWKVPRLSCG